MDAVVLTAVVVLAYFGALAVVVALMLRCMFQIFDEMDRDEG